ncbi:bile acid:sodium symporter family protein [Nocardiopsis sp. NRRL B-16309]|uniref:bile acid:sodium symporter family protein n=1 Tax=Nocardiopsis sp. NRRL B-16309 TaxID=1519494 RepID=UPI0006ADF087|nr:bile acid:sodium symporter family protein [Nocardiopsis sp. NRRL B-16309]KOX16361.1 bile acid:sodium symporter [Nocardiopsis sp. NRRL B-16309]
MSSPLFTLGLPLALGLVMFGLGLSLTAGDFGRVVRFPKAALISLVCQIVVLPLICLGLVQVFGLSGVLAVGMMLLVASPGGSSANLFSYLARGNVALNITLTAVNSVLSVFTLPIVVGLSITYFLGDDASIGLQFAKVLQVFAIVLVPVAIGMAVRGRFPGWAQGMGKTVKIGSTVVLALVILAAVVSQFDVLRDNITTLGPAALLLSVLSLGVGYLVPRLFGVTRGDATASAMEIGIHNATLAIAVAVSVLGDEALALPAAVYGVLMYLPASVAAYLLARAGRAANSRVAEVG